ncbi:SWIB-domain-containing protein [Laetiporus sulphureus 93-53]|uniref:SWIB-domain-containing protein n=1 Tax=Laetiporus sulphureus 93-53 TaxID=1314785 RepID=A0A165BQG0_9APHY|nr:SWIB-domain-containing protein [Laetiporus sulphureus 93-53]KZT01465.1 SWIB-domain-containing protein [Laetiporus sulphureus 93-53]
MKSQIQALEPKIREILTAPGIDLGTISAKRVRKQLLEQDSSLTQEFIKENKDEIDLLIAGVYEEVNAEVNGNEEEEEGASSPKGKRKRRAEKEEESVDENEEEGEEEVSAASPKAKKSKKSGRMTDEQLARQLSDEINGRSRSSRASSTRGTRGRGGAKRGGKRGAKSAATVDSEAEGSEGDGEPKKKKRGGGFQKEYMLSEPLKAVLDVEKMSRPQVVKQLWVYIKEHDLQNPAYKKEIICDDKLKAIFNVDKIDMFKMNKVLGQHLHEP